MKVELLMLLIALSASKVICGQDHHADHQTDNDNDSSEEEVDVEAVVIYRRCIEIYNITVDDSPEPGSREEKCVKMCGMKANGMILENGQIVKENILKEMAQMKNHLELQKIAMVLDQCIREVSTEEDECEVPDRLIKCADTKIESLKMKN